jgi:hypothetical protein
MLVRLPDVGQRNLIEHEQALPEALHQLDSGSSSEAGGFFDDRGMVTSVLLQG